MKEHRYLSVSISNNRVVILAKDPNDARKLFEYLKKLGIEVRQTPFSRCG